MSLWTCPSCGRRECRHPNQRLCEIEQQWKRGTLRVDPAAGPSEPRVTIFERVDGVLAEQSTITADTEIVEIVEEMSVEESRRRYPGAL